MTNDSSNINRKKSLKDVYLSAAQKIFWSCSSESDIKFQLSQILIWIHPSGMVSFYTESKG